MDNPTFVAGGGGNNWLGGVEMQIDLFQGGAKRAELSRERALQEKVTAMKQVASAGIRLEVRRAYYNLDSARQEVEVARAVIAQAQNSLRINQDRYDGGLTTVTDLLGCGRSDAAQPDGLLGGCLSVSYQLRQSRVSKRHLEYSIPGGDAMIRANSILLRLVPLAAAMTGGLSGCSK